MVPTIIGFAIGVPLIVGTLFVWVVLRMRALYWRVGSFECSISEPGSDTWTKGIAVFGAEYISWFPLISLGRKPRYTFSRQRLTIAAQSGGDERADTLVLRVRCNGIEQMWGMGRDSFTGLVSWMDAAPPEEEPTRI